MGNENVTCSRMWNAIFSDNWTLYVSGFLWYRQVGCQSRWSGTIRKFCDILFFKEKKSFFFWFFFFTYSEKIFDWSVTFSLRTKVVLFPFSFRRWKSFQRKSSSEKEASSVSFLLSKTKSWFHESTTKAFIYYDIYNVGWKRQGIIFRNEINQYSRCHSKKGFFFLIMFTLLT